MGFIGDNPIYQLLGISNGDDFLLDLGIDWGSSVVDMGRYGIAGDYRWSPGMMKKLVGGWATPLKNMSQLG